VAVAALTGTGRLADDLWLLAHHDVTGRPNLHARAAGLGLAGGLLAELVLAGSPWRAAWDRACSPTGRPQRAASRRTVMALQFLGTDPASEYNGSPTLWDDGDCYVIQGWRIRKDAEMTARQVAQAAGWHESKCSRIEHARTIPSPADIRAWCKVCGVPDQAAELTVTLRAIDSMYVEWRRQVPAGMRRLQEASLPLWERTRQFRVYEPGVIPGLFQTAEYASARMGRIIEFNGIPDDLDAAVAARLERQHVLRRGDHKFAVVLEESALRSRIGSPEMMAAQLAHLSRELSATK
jgi:transcriptional regulator with XRE-family HTH domain